MRKFSLRRQRIGDLNEELNKLRAQMNQEVRKKCYEIMAQKYRKHKV